MKASPIVAVVLLAVVTPPHRTAAQGPKEWGAQFNSAGVKLSYEEVGRKSIEGKVLVSYKLKASGFAKDKAYTVWGRWLDGATDRVDDEMLVSEAGYVASKKDGEVVELIVSLTDMLKGEPIQHALVSKDGAIRGFAHVIPFPLEVKGEGGCRVWLEMISPDGKSFGAFGEGFPPDEEVLLESQSGDVSAPTRAKTTGDGRFLTILTPAVPEKTGGSARFSASTKACKATLKYDWGDAMKKP
jgi:hypothetical protein